MLTNQSVQIQAVLFQNNKDYLIKALDSYSNAIDFDSKNDDILASIKIVWGDASPNPLFSIEEISHLKLKYQSIFKFEYFFFNENTGYGKGHNLLSEFADTDYLMIVNPDIIITADFFKTMLSPFENQSIGITEARQTPLEHPKKYDTVSLETPWSSGACFVIPTKLFRKLNGFDSQSFFMYYEDVDLSWRVRNVGFKLLYLPNAPVYHSKKLDDKGNMLHSYTEVRYSIESAMIFAYKWHLDAWLHEMMASYQSGTNVQQEAMHSFLAKKKNNQIRRINNIVEKLQFEDLINRY